VSFLAAFFPWLFHSKEFWAGVIGAVFGGLEHEQLLGDPNFSLLFQQLASVQIV